MAAKNDVFFIKNRENGFCSFGDLLIYSHNGKKNYARSLYTMACQGGGSLTK